MKYLKQFESSEWKESIKENYYPISTVASLTNYYVCDDCNALWRELNRPLSNRCPYCGSNNIRTLDSDDWFDMVKQRLDDPDEIKELEKERQMAYILVDLETYGKNVHDINVRKNIN